MRTASPALQALLAGKGPFLYADLFTVTATTGSVWRWSGADRAIVLDGAVFALGPAISGGSLKLARGLAVDSREISLAPGPTDIVGGQPLLAALRQGAFDRAGFLQQRAFLPGWNQPPVGAITVFSGTITAVAVGRLEARLTVKSALVALDAPMPPRIYQPACLHLFGDPACAFDRAALAVDTRLAGAGSTPTALVLAQPLSDGFGQGTVTLREGNMAGLSRSIQSQSGASLALTTPLPQAPDPGTAVTVTPGCDKTLATCGGRYGNLAHFRGFPFIPVAETAY